MLGAIREDVLAALGRRMPRFLLKEYYQFSPVHVPTPDHDRAGQRIDPFVKYDKAEVDRVKKLKLCNAHFLRDGCNYPNSCNHSHDYSPTEADLAALRIVARMAPCISGSACQDAKCIYGHRCPAPLARIRPAKGIKPCIFSETCKFPLELHEVDGLVVKTLVIR